MFFSKKSYRLFTVPVLMVFFWLFFQNHAFAYQFSITTSGSIDLDIASANNNASVASDNLNIVSTCPNGYTLAIAATSSTNSSFSDTTLYKSGDNTSASTISASAGTLANPATIIGNNLGTWGYSTSSSTSSGTFTGLTANSVAFYTKNSASASGGDNKTIYYGASAPTTLEPGTYQMSDDAVITYYLTTSAICSRYQIVYDGNNATAGTMGTHDKVGSNYLVDDGSYSLLASNYNRTGYGFAGWSTIQLNPDSATFATDLQTAISQHRVYGPQETVTLDSEFTSVADSSNTITMYAIWVKAETGTTLQTWNGCSSMSIGDIKALTDARDTNTYAIAKLVDGNCWMIENLRLDNTNTDNSTGALAQGYGASATFGNFSGLANPEITNFTGNTNANSLYYAGTQSGTATIDISDTSYATYRMPRYNNINTANRATNPTTNTFSSNTDGGMYSYGNYYTWSATMASTVFYTNPNYTDVEGKTSETAGTSLCPAGWRLPRGGNKTRESSNELWALIVDGINSGVKPANYDSSNAPYYTGSAEGTPMTNKLKKFPYNFLLSGYFASSTSMNRGSFGSYWTTTSYGSNSAYYLSINTSNVYPGVSDMAKYDGHTVRCIVASDYNVVFNANGGTGTMNSQVISSGVATNLSTNAFTRTSYVFTGWNTAPDGSGTDYSDAQSVTDIASRGTTIVLYAQWEEVCASGYICYRANGDNVVGTMGRQVISDSATSISLFPSNFSRANYGYAGWNTKPDGSGINYGPQEEITFTAGQYGGASGTYNGLMLYAVWVQSAGNLQNWTCPNNTAMPIGTVTALTDQRDNQTYAVAKLADGRCWMIENLRLDNTSTLTTANTNRPFNNGTTVTIKHNYTDTNTYNTLSSTSSVAYDADTAPDGWCQANTAACQDQSRLRTDNTASRATYASNTTTMSSAGTNLYSYGNYYNWYSATAGNSENSKHTDGIIGDICPTGWHLPTGTGSGEFALLSNSLGGYQSAGVAQNMTTTTTPTAAAMNSRVRQYPNNYLLSGYVMGATLGGRSTYGYYWSASSSGTTSTYALYYDGSNFQPGTASYGREYGWAVRCIANDGYIVTFDANDGSGKTKNQFIKTGTSTNLNANNFTRSDYKFVSWNTAANGTGTTYSNSQAVTNLAAFGQTITLYAQWEQSCDPGYICYRANGSNVSGTMGKQIVASSTTSISLVASNYNRSGYGFAGWNTKADYSGSFYGPQQDIFFTAGQYSGANRGLDLYAVWVASQGNLQNSSTVSTVCGGLTTAQTNGTATLASVSALTDQRDNQTYAIAKLADGKCWMIENLRLESQYTTSSTNKSRSQGYHSSFTGLASAEATTPFSNVTTANSLYSINGSTTNTISGSNQSARFPRYNNTNTASRASNPTSDAGDMYSYGNYYTWAALVASTYDNTANNSSVTGTSICPTGWRLPRGGDKNNATNNDYWRLNNSLNGSTPANTSSETRPYYTGSTEGVNASRRIRSFPNNFIRSGSIFNGSTLNQGATGVYWTSTSASGNTAYYLSLTNNDVYPGTNYHYKYNGWTARCLVNS